MHSIFYYQNGILMKHFVQISIPFMAIEKL